MGRNDSMESPQSLYHNRRIQRSAAFAIAVLILVIVGLYSRRDWPDVTDIHLDALSAIHSHAPPPPAGPPTTAAPKTAEEPLYQGKVPEYDPLHMPTIPTPLYNGDVPGGSLANGLDPTRVALLIETRPLPALTALLVQYIANLPPAWVVRVVGSEVVFSMVNKSITLARHIASGKLILTGLPDSYPVGDQEQLSATLTNLTFYSDFLAPAEWLLTFQTDSIICSAADESLDDWVAKGYSWVGAPWNTNSYGGNGGFSLRHVPQIIDVLKTNTREPNSLWEDRWLCDRLPNLAPPDVGRAFSVESVYYERPLGYHLRGSGRLIDPTIWGNQSRKRQILRYCPETKIILGNMRLESAEDRAESDEADRQLEADMIAALHPDASVSQAVSATVSSATASPATPGTSSATATPTSTSTLAPPEKDEFADVRS